MESAASHSPVTVRVSPYSQSRSRRSERVSWLPVSINMAVTASDELYVYVLQYHPHLLPHLLNTPPSPLSLSNISPDVPLLPSPHSFPPSAVIAKTTKFHICKAWQVNRLESWASHQPSQSDQSHDAKSVRVSQSVAVIWQSPIWRVSQTGADCVAAL